MTSSAHRSSADTASGAASRSEPGALEDRVRRLLHELTLDERASLSAGVDMWHAAGVERLGVVGLKVADGPAGVRGERFVGTTSACLPCGTALGATWNPELLEQVGRVLGEEARTKAADIVLAPTVNLHRNALAGRNFECFSEDPLLSARAAVAVIRGIQSTGVGACVKHLVANDSEFERHTISSDVDEATLRELYLVPFEAAVRDAAVVSVMSGYNRLNGVHCAQHPWLLSGVLRDEWGFDGIVVSDWWGTKGDESLEAGLDLEMPGPAKHLGARSAQRVRDGEVDQEVLDTTVGRLLRVAGRLGVLDLEVRPAERSEDRPEHREVLARAATEAIVLLRNDDVDGVPVLPLDPTTLERVAVIGPAADSRAVFGGGSAAMNPHHVVTVLEGLRERLGTTVEVVHEAAIDPSRTAPPLDPRRTVAPDGAHGVQLEYHDNRVLSGDPVHVERVDTPRLTWLGDDPAPGVRGGDFSLRVRTTFVADLAGEHTFALVTGGDGGRLHLDGEVVLDNFDDQRPGTAFFGLGSEEIRASVPLASGQRVELVAEYVSYAGLPAAALLVGHVSPVPSDGIDAAARAAAAADVAIVVVGLDQDTETEGEDRASLSLPGASEDLVRAVAAANPRTVVLVNAGSVVDLDAAADVPALAQSWYLGQETGVAVARVLCGDESPSGRLPTTYGRRVEDWPSWQNYPGDDGHVLYGEQRFIGHRGFDERGVEPRFCFGHGLSYTTFGWSGASVSSGRLELAGAAARWGRTACEVSVEVENTGGRAGAEVVQCYLVPVPRRPNLPRRQLVGFTKVHLGVGESASATIELDERAFAVWDRNASTWRVDPGSYELRLGASLDDVRAVAMVEVVPAR